MGFLKSLIIAAAVGLAAASPFPVDQSPSNPEGSLVKRASAGGTCTGGAWTPVVVAPSNSAGTPFCESSWGTTYLPIKSLTVWGLAKYVGGIQATYVDGSQSPVYGIQAGYKVQTISVNYAAGETFTQVDLFAPGTGTYLHHVLIKTSTGATLNIGEVITGYGYYYQAQPVASGVLFGIEGSASNAINRLGFLFLQSKVASVAITNLAFPDGPTDDQNLSVENLEEAHYYNGQAAGTNQTWTFADSKAIAVAHTFASATTDTYTTAVAFMIMGSIPIIGGITVGSTTTFTWAEAYMTTNTIATTRTDTVTWTANGSLQPGQGVDCIALVSHGSGTFPYTSTVTIKLADGTQFSYPENGQLTIDDVSNAIVETTTNNSS